MEVKRSKSIRSRRFRAIFVTTISIVAIYLVLVLVFGRPLSIVGSLWGGEKSGNTGSTVGPGPDYDKWDRIRFISLIGLSADEVRDKLGEPGIDNTLAPQQDGGLKFISASTGRDTTSHLDEQTVVGYCVVMELENRLLLSVGTASSKELSPSQLELVRKDPRASLASYENKQRCGPKFNGGIHVDSVLVRPH